MTRSSLTEETPATPGWVDARITAIFAPFGPSLDAVRDAYAECLAGVRGAVDVETGYDRCRRNAVQAARDVVADADALDHTLQTLEAEISSST